MGRPKVTLAAGIANVAASLSSFAIQKRTGVALEPSYSVVASSPFPISSSTTQPSLSFTPASLMSVFQLPVPGSAPFSSITSQPQFGVTSVSLVSALQVPNPGSGHLLLLHQSPLPLSAYSVPGLDFSSPPPIFSPAVLSPLSTLSQCNSSFSESCSCIWSKGCSIAFHRFRYVGLHLISQICTFDFKFFQHPVLNVNTVTVNFVKLQRREDSCEKACELCRPSSERMK